MQDSILNPTKVTEKPYHQSAILVLLRTFLRILIFMWARFMKWVFPNNSKRKNLAVRMHVPMPNPLNLSWITSMLAVGGQFSSESIPALTNLEVRNVVDVRLEDKDDEELLRQNGIDLLYLPTPDVHPLSLEDLRKGSEWINNRLQKGQKVLVHCKHGVGRSVLLTAAALVDQGLTAKEAFTLIAEKRWQSAPNEIQVARLMEYEQQRRAQAL